MDHFCIFWKIWLHQRVANLGALKSGQITIMLKDLRESDVVVVVHGAVWPGVVVQTVIQFGRSAIGVGRRVIVVTIRVEILAPDSINDISRD